MKNLVSVIIPTYHGRGGLQTAIDSVLRQQNVNVEVIVVDDNDPDTEWRKNTELDMANYASDPRVKYIKHPSNKNGAAARNTGIKASHGDFIAFLDDDDLYLDGKLESQSTYLLANPQYNAVYGQMLRSGKIVKEKLPTGDLSKDLLLLESAMQTSTLMFRAESIKAIDGFDESFYRHQDYEMLLRFFHAGNKMGAILNPVSEFGRNAGENIPEGERLEKIKYHFLSTFSNYINEFDLSTPGFKNKVYAVHYSGVFLSHLKHFHISKALRVLLKYSFKSPKYFYKPIFRSLILHIQGKA